MGTKLFLDLIYKMDTMQLESNYIYVLEFAKEKAHHVPIADIIITLLFCCNLSIVHLD